MTDASAAPGPGMSPSEGSPSAAVPAPDAPTATPRRSRRVGLTAGVAAAHLVAVGGPYPASRGLGAGGSQPADVLPASAIAYLRIDMDPSVGQKVAAFRLMDKLPEAKKAFGDANPKKALFELLGKNSQGMKGVDYTNDVEPWLGDRFGVAVLGPAVSGGRTVVAAAIQVKDEAKANAGLDKLQKASRERLSELRPTLPRLPTPGGTVGTAATELTAAVAEDDETARIFRDGYVIVTDKRDEQTVRQAMERGVLSARSEFAEDMNAIGEQGIASGWVDSTKLLELTGMSSANRQNRAAQQVLTRLGGGHGGMALRVTPDVLEMVAVQTGGNPAWTATTPVSDLSSLPTDTAAFVSISNGAEALGKSWQDVRTLLAESGTDTERALAQIEEQSGIKLPDDAQTMLGQQLDLVVSDKTLGNGRLPKMGLRVKTDTAKAEAVLDKLKRAMTSSGQSSAAIPQTSKGGRLYLALDQAYLDDLTNGGGLAEASGLAQAVPDVGKQVMVAFVNLDKLERYYIDAVPADLRETVRAIKALGISSAPVKNGNLTTYRVVVN